MEVLEYQHLIRKEPFIKDLYDKSIVGYQVSENMTISFVTNTIRKALIKNKIKPEHLIIH